MTDSALADFVQYLSDLATRQQGTDAADAELLRRFAAERDEAAFAILLRRHSPLVFAVCRQVLRDAHDAEDAFQATFLVLARKAASIRKQQSLAAWLHRVAVNVARTARTSAAQRRAQERQAVVMSQGSPADEVALRDEQPVIHEEVNRLPEKYRVPIVLCYFQDKTHDEAARELGWPVGTVKGRLARARDLLRARLARRGLALSGGGLAAALTQTAALGQVPAVLLGETLRVALSSVGNGAVPVGTISARVLALTQGACQTVTATKVISLIVLVLAVSLAGFAAAIASGVGREAGPEPLAAQKQEVVAQAKANEDRPAAQAIQLTLANVRPEYRPGEAVDLTLTIKNNGKEEFSYLQPKLTDLDGFTMLGPDGTEVQPGINPVEIGFAGILVRVRPGESVTVKDSLRGVNLPKGGTNRYLRHRFYPMETPGVYRLRIRIGDASSNELKVTLLAKEGAEQADDAVKADLKKLQGTWHMVGCEEGGKPVAPENVNPNDFLSFEGTTFFFKSGLRGLKGTFTIDPSKTPKWMDQTSSGGLVFKGIYEFKGDRLRVFLAAPGGERPTEFKTKVGDKLWIRTYERVKVAPDGPGAQRGDAGEGTDLHGDPLPPGAIARLGTVRFRHGKGMTAIALSRDGKTITSVGGDGSIVLHDAATGAKLRSIAGEAAARVVVLAPDGRSLATVIGGRRIIVRDTATGDRIREFQVANGPIFQLAFSADGKILAGGEQYLIHLWDIHAGKKVSRINPPGVETLRVALSPDGKTLATAGWDRKERPILCLWETASGRRLSEWQPGADMEETHALAFSPDGKRLASASGYGDPEQRERLRVWAVPTGERLLEVPGRFHGLRYSPCGKLLAARGAGAVSLRAADTGKEMRRIPASGPVSFAADGKMLALADRYSTITFWDVPTGQQLRAPLLGHRHWVRNVQFLAGGKTLASLGDDATYFWQVPAAKSIGRFDGPVSQRALSPDGKTLAAIFSPKTPASHQRIGLWDTATGKKLHDLEPSSSNLALMDLNFSPDATTLAVPLGDRTIQFWSVGTGKVIRQFVLSKVLAQSLAFSPDGKTLAICNGNSSLEVQGGQVPRVWLVDAVTGRELRQPFELPETAAARGRSSRIISMNPMLAFSADGRILAAAATSGGNWGVEHVLQVWAVETGQLLCRLERVSNRFALSPDGKSLVTMTADPDRSEPPRLWEVATGKLRAPIRGHLGSVTGAAFSPDGRLLATGSQDTTVLIWDALSLTGEPPAAGNLSRKELEALWADLGGADAAKGYRAIRALVAAPEPTVPFLREHLRALSPLDGKALARLIADLDAGQFAVREKAMHELEKLGPSAGPALRQVLAGQPSLEVRRRVEQLLAKQQRFILTSEGLRSWRAIEVLEHIATPQARKLLEELARGVPAPGVSEEAQAALQRLARLPAGS